MASFSDSENKIENLLVKTSQDFYKKIMDFKLIEKMEYFSTLQIKTLHSNLYSEICKALVTTLGKNGDSHGHEIQLRKSLKRQFKLYKESNLRNLKRKSTQVEEIIEQLEISYRKTQLQHNSSRNTVPENLEDQLEQKLRMELWTKVGEFELHKIHWDRLRHQLNLGDNFQTKHDSYYLGIQINYGCISMGVWKDGKCIKVKNEHGEVQTPSVVGLTKARTLVYGSQVERAERKGNLIGKYHIGEHFEPRQEEIQEYIRKYELPLKKQVHQVSISLFLGFLLQKLKISAERQLQMEMSGCVITVPFYFSSYQRLEIKYSAIAAGFEKINVKILSDSSMAAFGLASVSKQMTGSSHRNIRVVSENNGNLYAAIYKFERGKASLKMMEHIRWHPGMNWNISTGKDFTDEEKGRMLCEDLRNKYNQKYFEDRDDCVVLHCENPLWERILSSECEKMGATIKKGNPLNGIIRLFTNFKDQIQDLVAHQVVSSSKDISCERVNPRSFRIGVDRKETEFFQKLLGKILYPIGTLRIVNFLPEARYAVSFSVTSEGYITLDKVTRIRGNVTPTTIDLNGGHDYVWVGADNALKKEIPEVAPVIQQLFTKSIEEVKRREEKLTETIAAEKHAKQENITGMRKKLEERCEEMWRMMETNQINLSDLMRPLIERVIVDSRLFAKKTSPSLQAVEVQLASLNKYYDKYFGGV